MQELTAIVAVLQQACHNGRGAQACTRQEMARIAESVRTIRMLTARPEMSEGKRASFTTLVGVLCSQVGLSSGGDAALTCVL